jgi:ferredoxin-NADP reductase
MQLTRVKFIETIPRISTVASFRFVPAEKVGFTPGQFLQIIFDEADYSNKELNKYLSFSSSPTKEYIEVTKRLSDSKFSQGLKSLKAGDEILLKAPLGSCVFKEEYKKIGFLIGGIGITPVISIIEYIMDKNLGTDVVLLYSNRAEQDIAFRKELDYGQSINKKIKIIYTLTDSPSQDKGLIFGIIDKNLLMDKITDFKQRIFFIFGPPKMVEAMNSLCLGLGCDKKNIKTENFIGY